MGRVKYATECAECAGLISKPRHRKKYCSRSCQQAAYRKRHFRRVRQASKRNVRGLSPEQLQVLEASRRALANARRIYEAAA